MKRELFTLCGPLSINSYGTAAVIGILLCLWLAQKHPQVKKLHLQNKLIDILLVCIFASIIGGRILYVLSEPEADSSLVGFLSIWDGGLSLLGGITATAIALPLFFIYNNLPVLACLDIIAIHAPLFQAIGRIGCFLAGCCYGASTHHPWGFIYTDPQSMAPLHVALHPTQLYSAIGLLSIFFLLYCIVQKVTKKPGQLTALYLMLISMERFLIDFWRADRMFSLASDTLSTNQLFALAIFVQASILLVYTSIKHEHI